MREQTDTMREKMDTMGQQIVNIRTASTVYENECSCIHQAQEEIQEKFSDALKVIGDLRSQNDALRAQNICMATACHANEPNGAEEQHATNQTKKRKTPEKQPKIIGMGGLGFHDHTISTRSEHKGDKEGWFLSQFKDPEEADTALLMFLWLLTDLPGPPYYFSACEYMNAKQLENGMPLEDLVLLLYNRKRKEAPESTLSVFPDQWKEPPQADTDVNAFLMRIDMKEEVDWPRLLVEGLESNPKLRRVYAYWLYAVVCPQLGEIQANGKIKLHNAKYTFGGKAYNMKKRKDDPKGFWMLVMRCKGGCGNKTCGRLLNVLVKTEEQENKKRKLDKTGETDEADEADEADEEPPTNKRKTKQSGKTGGAE
jgi:hypothetical protein